MTVEEFNKQIERLREVFGVRNFPDQRAALIWNVIRDLGDSWFTNAVNQWIGNRKASDPPLLAEIEAAGKAERQRAERARESISSWAHETQPRYYCSSCNGSGVVWRRRDKIYDFVFKCRCDRGKARPEAWPELSHSEAS